MSAQELSQKKILIFGGTGELMGEIARCFAKHDATVIIIGRTLKEPIEQIEFIEFDILKDDIHSLFQQIYEKYTYIDMIINGAGVNASTDLLQLQPKEIVHIFEINFYFVVQCCIEYIQRTLALNKSGKIINIGSVSAIHPLSKVFMYSASKAALHNFSKNIAREYGGQGITTNILVPGFFPAEQNKKILDAERKQTILNETPVNRFGKPSDLNGMMLLLASDDSSFINGAELVIDGGFCITKI